MPDDTTRPDLTALSGTLFRELEIANVLIGPTEADERIFHETVHAVLSPALAARDAEIARLRAERDAARARADRIEAEMHDHALGKIESHLFLTEGGPVVESDDGSLENGLNALVTAARRGAPDGRQDG